MSTASNTNRVQRKGVKGYVLAMENMDAASPESKIVGEELDAFFERARKRLDEIREPVSLEESNKEIRALVQFRFGYPTAKTVVGRKRGPNAWNEFQGNGKYKRVKSESGIVPFFPGSFSLLGLGKSQHGEVIKIMSEEYWHNRENDSLTGTSSRSTIPALSAGDVPLPRKEKTPSSLGDALLPHQEEKWQKERRKLWKDIVRIVLMSPVNAHVD